jgi:tRNA dimethylallyltransferase
VLVVLGATATGKSEVAIELARRLPGEIVSVDSACVYRGLDVGTAKPSAALRAEIPHHLVDCCDPRDEFTVARFVDEAERAIDGIAARGRTPVLAGGTGLYLRSLLHGLVASPPPDEELRESLALREAGRRGSLRRLLQRLDPEAAARITPRDELRTVRALEHRLSTGRRLSSDRAEWSRPERRASLKIGLEMPRDQREARIRRRVDAMIEGGLLEETRALLEAGVPPSARSMRALGYREAVEVLRGERDVASLREALSVATRQYAKRQDTWFRKESGVLWMRAPDSIAELSGLVGRVMLAWVDFRRRRGWETE